jgi:hypothetical protein
MKVKPTAIIVPVPSVRSVHPAIDDPPWPFSHIAAELTSPKSPQSEGVRLPKPGGIAPFDKKVPTWIEADPRFQMLCTDADHNGGITPCSIREAVTALTAEKQGLLARGISRAGNGVDFYDGKGQPVEVKTFPSNGQFNARYCAQVIKEELNKTRSHRDDDFIFYKQIVIVDCTYLTDEHHAAIWRELQVLGLSGSEKSRLLELIV